MSITIAISQIRTDGGTQSRAELSTETIADYAEAMQSGATFPAVIVFYDGKVYWLADGFHRYHAAEKTDEKTIEADVRQGTQRDATLFSLGANDSHGLRRSNRDKRSAVEKLLRDPEWGAKSDRWIAETAHVSNRYVGNVRAELGTVNVHSCSESKRTGKDGKERRLSALPKEDDNEDWACTLLVTVPHSTLPSTVRALRGLGFAGGGGSSRKMSLPAGASIEESKVSAGAREDDGEEWPFDAMAEAVETVNVIGRRVRDWPANESLHPLIVQLRNYLATLERMDKERGAA
jgi:hypothetical protein